MSCKHCEEVQDKGDIAYVRVGPANVGIIGCNIHAGHVIRAVNAIYQMDKTMGEEREIVRVIS